MNMDNLVINVACFEKNLFISKISSNRHISVKQTLVDRFKTGLVKYILKYTQYQNVYYCSRKC